MARKAKKTRKRYAPAEKAKILAAAAKEELTGEQVAKKFGIAQLTFYKWRGPGRSDALARKGKRGPGRARGTGKVHRGPSAIRKGLPEQNKKRLPPVIRGKSWGG